MFSHRVESYGLSDAARARLIGFLASNPNTYLTWSSTASASSATVAARRKLCADLLVPRNHSRILPSSPRASASLTGGGSLDPGHSPARRSLIFHRELSR